MAEEMVSIILPCYNSEKYIDKCIFSILRQTYSNFELIIINDGSTDDSSKKILKFNDKRIHVVNQNNKGRSSARNLGLRYSSGKFVTFIDSDDFVSKKYLANLIGGFTSGVEMTMSNLNFIDESGQVRFNTKYVPLQYEIMNGRDATSAVLSQKPDCEVCGKMFLSKLFDDIEFPEGLIYEDFLTTISILSKVKKVSYFNGSDYFYLQRSNNTIHRSFDLKKMDILEICDSVQRTVLKEYPELQSQLMGRLFAAYSNVWLQIDGNGNFGFCSRILWDRMCRCRKQIDFKKVTKTKVLIGLYISFMGKKVFRRAYKMI